MSESTVTIRDCHGQGHHLLVVEDAGNSSVGDLLTALGQWATENEDAVIAGVNVCWDDELEQYLEVAVSTEKDAPFFERDTYIVTTEEPEPNVYDKALELLGPNGEKWIKGLTRSATGDHCLIGAVAESVLGEGYGVDEAYVLPEVNALLPFIWDIFAEMFRAPSDFNDKDDTTFADVEKVLKAASSAVGA